MVNPSKYPGTHTYINLLNIQRASEFAKKEASITSLRSFELLQEPTIILQTFDLKHLKSIHYHLFQDLFKWAGKIRSFDMQKGQNIFTPYNEIETFFQVVSDEIKAENNLKNMALHEKSIKLARYLGLINMIHPFPEGNGRAQRIFISHLALSIGCKLDWKQVHSWEVVQTSINVHQNGDYTSMQNMIERILICG